MPRPPLSRESSKLGKSSKDLTNDDTEPSVDSIAENPPKKTALKDNDPRRASLTENTRYLLESVLNKAVDLSPAAVRPFLKPVVPAVTAFFKAMEVAMPYISVAVNTVIIYSERFYKIIEPYDPDLILPMIIGIFLTLFGGHFMMLIACFEAYRICGWDSTRDGFVSLWEDYIALKRANDEDDARDDDNDGIADVLEISKHELLTRKLLLFLRACDPQKLSNALNGIYSGFIAVSAALRIKFARTIALGVAIGDMLSNLALKMFVPFIEKLVPPAYHKWIPYIVRYGCKGIGIWIASTIERVLATFHVAFRGANMFVTAFAVYCAKRGYPKLSEGYWDELFAYSMCAFGIYMQLATGFTLGPILGLILWPFTSLETALTAYIYSSAEAPTAGAPIDLGAALGGMAAGGAPAAA